MKTNFNKDTAEKIAPQNRTLTCLPEEIDELSNDILRPRENLDIETLSRSLIKGDFFDVTAYLPNGFADLIILDPPYNLTKNFNGNYFRKLNDGNYTAWFRKMVSLIIPMMKPDATLYVCSDWQTSTIVYPILQDHFFVRNRITWEREKGRGAKTNWKNNTEDIWFCTKTKNYYFDVKAVKTKRKVIAPYRENGKPKDWEEGLDGNYRLTHPSNIWTDLSVPFWSMPENTRHPTQKPEKLFAKLVLASSKQDDFVFDPFVGSGTSMVVAEKLGRRWCGIDINEEYLCWAQKRINMARADSTIQGYSDGVFWERNSLPEQQRLRRSGNDQEQCILFE